MFKQVYPFMPNKLSSQEVITDWIAHSLKKAKENKQSCEIEVTHGTFSPVTSTSNANWTSIKNLSKQNLLILKTTSR